MKTRAPEAPPLILIVWQDAWFDFDLEDIDCRHSEYLVTTVGFLVADDPRFIFDRPGGAP